MYIERAGFHQVNPTSDPYVVGQIAIEGEFTVHEWENIRETFIAMGLFQLQKGQKLSAILPTRQECLNAFRDGPEAIRKLEQKYPAMVQLQLK